MYATETVQSIDVTVYFLFSLQRDEATRQCRELSQELVNLRGDLGKLGHLDLTLAVFTLVITKEHTPFLVCFLFLVPLSLQSTCQIVFQWHGGLYILAVELLHHRHVVVCLVQFFGCYDLMQSFIWVIGALLLTFRADVRRSSTLVNLIIHYIAEIPLDWQSCCPVKRHLIKHVIFIWF